MRTVLGNLPPQAGLDRLIVGTTTADDAAVVRIEGETVIVQTVDFFTPIVDDPETFGAIAAANSISDVYAMGAEPIVGLAIAGFPTDQLPLETLEAILRGGAAKASEAGFPVAGGHTIIDDVPKYGLVVTGLAKASAIVRNDTARAGDFLYLTKPIGNGVLVSAYRARSGSSIRNLVTRGSAPDLSEAIDVMTLLNRGGARAMVRVGATAATDVTGYGLIGHLLEMCLGAGIGARIEADSVPLLSRARELAEKGFVPAGTTRNMESFRKRVENSRSEIDYLLLCDAQTSGGLLIAIPEARASELESELRREEVPVARIGQFTDRSGTIEIV